MAFTWKSIPELYKINLCEHFSPVEILVIGGYIIAQYLQTGNLKSLILDKPFSGSSIPYLEVKLLDTPGSIGLVTMVETL